MSSSLINRNISMTRGRTSMRFEPEIWDALFDVCAREKTDIHTLVRKVGECSNGGGRTSAVRVFLVKYLQEATTEEGHRRAGHGTRE